MCETEIALVSVCSILLVTASFCRYWVYPGKKVGQYSEIKIQNRSENEYKIYCLDGDEWFHLIDEDTVGCNSTWSYGRKRCENYMWWTEVKFRWT